MINYPLRQQYVIGLTGGIGSGKSEAVKYFTACGIQCIDADVVARHLVDNDAVVRSQIINYFGQRVLTDEKEIDRSWLRSQIFHCESKKKWLEELLHPLIYHTLKEELPTLKSAYVLLVSPLLLETKQRQLVHRVLLIDCCEQRQVCRASKRDNTSEESIRAIMKVQFSREKKRCLANDIVDNNASILDLHQSLAQIHRHYLSLVNK